jgi:preprotein translocase subunit SecB
MDETKQPDLRIAQIFLATAHFEHRADALKLPASTKEPITYNVSVTGARDEEGKSGLITVAIRTTDDESLYRFHVEMTGIVERETETPNLSIEEYITKQGAGMMFPFLREAVASLTSRGRFGPIWIKPFNFRALERENQAMPGLSTTTP